MYQAGDSLPSVDLFENNPGTKVNLADELKNKKAVIFAVPGAFTPGCSKVNMIDYLISLTLVHAMTMFVITVCSCIKCTFKT